MAATITNSDRFSEIRVRFNGGYPHGFSSVRFRTDADPQVSGRPGVSSEGFLPTSGEHYDNLVVLQEIYASSDGFRDAGGNDLSIDLIDCPFTTDVAELEEHGFLNPLDADSWDRWIAFLKMRGRFQEGATITNEGDIDITFGLSPEFGVPADGITTFSLDPYRAYDHGGVRFWFETNVNAAGQFTNSNMGQIFLLRALHEWLDGKRVSGSAVDVQPTTRSDANDGLGNSRIYEIDQGGSAGTVKFESLGWTREVNSDGHITQIHILFEPTSDSPSPFDIEALNEVLESATAPVETGTLATIEPKWGSVAVAIRGLQWLFDSVRRLTPMNDRLLHRGRDSQGSYELPLESSYAREVEYDDLDDDPDHTGQKIMASGSHVRVVHFDQDSNGIIRIPDIEGFVYSPGCLHDFEIHHVSDTAGVTCEIRDSDNDNIATLLYDERIPLRAVRDKNDAGELRRGLGQFLRKYRRNDYSQSIAMTSANYMTLSSSRIRFIPFSSDDPDYINSEAFEEGSDQPSNGSTYSGQSTYFFKYTHKVKKEGRLTVSGHIIVGVNVTASGSLSGPNIDLSHFRGTTETILAGKSFADMSAGDEAVFDFMAEVDIEEDDVIGVSLVYANATTVNLGDVVVSTHRMTMNLDQKIHLES